MSATCEADIGTAFTGPKTCGKPAKHFAQLTDSASQKHRDGFPVCGIHANSLERKLRFNVTRDNTDPAAEAVERALRKGYLDVRPVGDPVVGFVARSSFSTMEWSCFDRSGVCFYTAVFSFGVGEACEHVRLHARNENKD